MTLSPTLKLTLDLIITLCSPDSGPHPNPNSRPNPRERVSHKNHLILTLTPPLKTKHLTLRSLLRLRPLLRLRLLLLLLLLLLLALTQPPPKAIAVGPVARITARGSQARRGQGTPTVVLREAERGRECGIV